MDIQKQIFEITDYNYFDFKMALGVIAGKAFCIQEKISIGRSLVVQNRKVSEFARSTFGFQKSS